ncbi:MAG: M36 family metallopeptidase [Candidatus Riflebacteria bacterium]|nr:M36 family metallopeptidase [Candidatus Riflebacteria bacterium]
MKYSRLVLKNAFQIVIIAVFLAAFPANCAVYSPTQVSGEHCTQATPLARASQVAMDGLTGDPEVLHGVDLAVFTHDGNAVSSLRGCISVPLNGKLEVAAREWLAAHSDIFNLPSRRNSAVSQLELQSEGGATHVLYGMSIDGIPVYGALVDLHVGGDRRVMLANGSFPTIGEVTNQQAISGEMASEIAMKILDGKGVRGEFETRQVVFPEKDGTGRIAWFVQLPLAEPLGDWEIVIDAETGKELSRRNQMMFKTLFAGNSELSVSASLSRESPNGKGSVFLAHPLISSATVEPLYYLASSSLEGNFSIVRNDAGPSAYNAENTHIYLPEDTHFDEVNVYYHMNAMHDFFKSMGFARLDWPMLSSVHYDINYDNAGYSPITNSFFFGDGKKYNAFSKEESIIYHEYSHAALQAIKYLPYFSEAGAMNEGQADYFACSFSNDPLVGEYVTNKMGKPCLRNLTDNVHYPENITGEVHEDGRIWGCTLWDLRIALGSCTSDILVHKSFFFLKADSPKFIDGMNAILAADQSLFAGANKTVIEEVFKKRGISVTVSAPAFRGDELRSIARSESLHNFRQ